MIITPAHQSAVTKYCKRLILEALKTSQSGHPGGSLSSLDILITLYLHRLRTTNEPCIISNGHISPAVYSILSALSVTSASEFITTFRQLGSPFEGHVARTVPGVWYGTGPLGSGLSVAVGVAIDDQRHGRDNRTFALIGDGEAQEGIIHEAALVAAKESLSNLTVFCDANEVQLSDSIENTCPIDIPAIFKAHGWCVRSIDGHNPQEILQAVHAEQTTPTLVYCRTVMGHGISLLEIDGRAKKSTWHGKAPTPEMIDTMLEQLVMTDNERALVDEIQHAHCAIKTPVVDHTTPPPVATVNPGTPYEYQPNTLLDCRTAYGAALKNLCAHNPHITALTADLGESVKMSDIKAQFPNQFIECGIGEQNMMALAGGSTLRNTVPFVSTFGVFTTSRAKGQMRLNDINQCNVKVVSTHCGLSVGMDGPTHQALDDLGTAMGLLNTEVIEPADANHCDRIIRYISTTNKPTYVRMGRHKLPVLTHEDGSLLYPQQYQYVYGSTAVLRRSHINTLVLCAGSVVAEVLQAWKQSNNAFSIIIASSPKKYDETLLEMLQTHTNLITVEDHNPYTGYAAGVSKWLLERNITPQTFIPLGVTEYQLSGTPEQLYHSANIGCDAILQAVQSVAP